jgi:endonuclease-3
MPRNSSRPSAAKPAQKTATTKKAVAKLQSASVKKASAKPPSKSAKSAAKKPNAAAIAPKVCERLAADYPEVTCALENESAFELLIATILSAQCTDERVNMVTPELFRRWPTPEKMAAAPLEQLEKVIHSTGFYRNKAKNIQGCSRELADLYDGEVPRDIDAMVKLPGVGRKTANVVLGTCYGMATGVVVDTHVTRISNRLGLTTHTDATKIEKDLMELVPQDQWVDFAHRMIHHGRQICMARKPKCDECSMNGFCPKIGVA